MRIYVSSTFEDLREYRAAVAKVLRQMGHELVAMEEYTAESAVPIEKCLKDVREADAYIGIFGWRYGYVPKKIDMDDIPTGIVPGKTSITEAEYRQAADPLIFLADPQAPWPPHHMDAIVGEDGGKAIAALRKELGNRHTVGFFRTPADLASAVSAAIYRVEVRKEFNVRAFLPKPSMEMIGHGDGGSLISSLQQIESAISEAGGLTAISVDLGTSDNLKWWASRLYLLASLAADLTGLKVLVFVENADRLVGIATPDDVRRRLAPLHKEISRYESILKRGKPEVDLNKELTRRFTAWADAFSGPPDEAAQAAWVRPRQLRQWLGTTLTERYIEWPREDEASMDLIQRIIDWPLPFVALVEDKKFSSVVERRGLAEHIARLFVQDQVRRMRRT